MTDPVSAPPPLAAGQIEIWKKIVDVQQHFNDLELRIRNFALVVTGAFLGLGGYAIKDADVISAFGWDVSLAGLVVVSAIFPLLAFYFMDRLWYHRLLDGSVRAGIETEAALKSMGYKVDLGSQISAKSPFRLWLLGTLVHSKTKMDIFYTMLVVTLLVVGSCLGFGIRPQTLVDQPKAASIAAGDQGATASDVAPTPDPPATSSVDAVPPAQDSASTSDSNNQSR